MLARASRALALSCVGLIAFAPMAGAQRAPITYAGQGEDRPVETASLVGGGDASYGYGARRGGERDGVVIDIRRAGEGGRPETPPVATAPAADAEVRDAEQGSEPWLERERVGPPYEAGGRWYVPTPEPGYAETGVASWYGPAFHGQRTASGEIFDQEGLTAAHPTLPIPSLVQVTNLDNGREIIVRVNDRGPFVGGRLIDLSRRSAEVLGFEAEGQARVHVRYLGPAPRRVNADGAGAPASSPPPLLADRAEEGPTSLLPPSAPSSDAGVLAGAPIEEAPYAPPSRPLAPPAGGFFVQVGAYSDLANAHRVRDAVGAAGPVEIDVRRSAGGAELFRVRVGPWTSRAEADAARRQLAALGYAETIVAAR